MHNCEFFVLALHAKFNHQRASDVYFVEENAVFSARKRPAQLGAIRPITTAQVVEKITRLRVLSANDPDLRRLLEELAPYFPMTDRVQSI